MTNAVNNQEFYFDNKHFENEQNLELNKSFSQQDIKRAIKSLKNNKSCGNDLILNKLLKCAASKMLSIFANVSIFYLILESFRLPGLKELFTPFIKIRVVQEILTIIEVLPYSVVL